MTTSSTRRPTWVVVLSLAMLVFGGNLLLQGLSILRGGGAAALSDEGRKEEGPGERLARNLRAVSRSLIGAHPVAVGVNAASKVVLALVLLLAVASVLSWDPRGRGLTLFAASASILYDLADTVFLVAVVRPGVVAAAPLLMTSADKKTAEHAAAIDQLISFTDLQIAVTGVVGLAFGVLLLTFFGGRRGRLFYGLERQPHHGA